MALNPDFKRRLQLALRSNSLGSELFQILQGIDTDATTAVSGARIESKQRQTTVKVVLEDVEVALTDEAGAVAYGGLKILDLPQGLQLFQGAVLDLAITKDAAGVNDDWDGDISLGTVTAGNDGTLSSTEANLIPSTATPQASSGATTGDAVSTATESGSVLDGRSTPVDIYLNILVDDADHDVTSTPTNLILNGVLWFTYTDLGDN